ncbi:MAG TPA: histidine kinase [Candidatus Binatia bacterium]|nr:histidine kinase [Candidatus Binatia bacterium]
MAATDKAAKSEAASDAASESSGPSGPSSNDGGSRTSSASEDQVGPGTAAASSGPLDAEASGPPDAITSTAELAARLAQEAANVAAEVAEIDLLINQARTEASRHDARRQAANEKLQMAAERLAAGAAGSPKELAELANQLVTIGRKAALMEAQIDLLEGKKRSGLRLVETIKAHEAQARALAGLPDGGRKLLSASDADGGTPLDMSVDQGGPVPPGVSRMILTAQEDMRREIARQMHDGPAQSLTNIVLQAQIVERLMAKDPGKATAEVHQLISMVQRTLDATKTFIFDVRPMVLDDLGLVPTLRRASRDRGRRIGIAVDFESVGVDRRLPVELESGLFRMLDDALAAHTAGRPDMMSLHLDWGENLKIDLTAGRRPELVPDPDLPPEDAELPPALAEMVAERRRAHAEAVEAARIRALARLPETAWREVASRARILGIKAQMLDDGSRLHLEVALPPDAPGGGGGGGDAAAAESEAAAG